MVRVVTLLATSVVIVAATCDSGGRFCVVLGIEELEEAVLRFPKGLYLSPSMCSMCGKQEQHGQQGEELFALPINMLQDESQIYREEA